MMTIVGTLSLCSSMTHTDSHCLVPIYDCRETRFRFDENSFSTINDLLLYNTDPDPDSLVSVAYTVNSMAYAQVVNNPRTEIGVFFNILFVLLLGQLPEPSVKSESE